MKEIELITIVTESVIQSRLIEDLQRVGARGWTLSAAQGAGPRNRRVSEVEGGNIRVEVLADSTTIERIWQLLHESYFPNYAVSAWQSTVLVSRSDRYSNDTQKDGA
ncbi:MAG: hypothetical protein WBJ33_03610 [Candidatus Nanopelagicales bacterium]|jgi:nitrogen regulatory protein P-II 2